ncbi:glycosyltransferase family 39 protein [Gordonia sp. 852002-10350_SCH5691597]|uniref:glycosyltransferase family 39 protein n=1 Tax=Gordonia sp. 852002-10350_SCH5691597 TaxID=1834085 RepID=UPI0018D3CE19|nr:glycosyltransferase family 39 protein [Gordonia sp. 852002-10350_SCH5691597]
MTATERLRSARPALVVGIFGVVLCAFGSWRPSHWYDEAATVSAVHRPLSAMWDLLALTDAVHALYYLCMHVWTKVFGLSEFSLRFPSALAIGIAAGLLVVLAARLWDTRFGVIAGLVLLCLPRTTWAGSEARSYAGTIALAIAMTLVLLIALDVDDGATRRRRWGWWVAYAAVCVVGVVWFFFTISLLSAHLLIVLVRSRGRDRLQIRRTTVAFVISAIVVCAVVAPFARIVISQRGQISWVEQMSPRTLGNYARFEFFDGATIFLIVGALVVAVGLAAAVLGAGGRWSIPVIGMLWVFVPAALVFVFSWLVDAVYTPRYLIFTAGGLALILAWAVRQIARDRVWVAALLVLVLAAAATPSYLADRSAYGRLGGTDFSEAADFIGANAHPGDCVAFSTAPTWSPVSQRVVLRAKPADFAGLRDVGPSIDAVRADSLWDGDKPVTAYRRFAEQCQVMWVITDKDRDHGYVVYPGATAYWLFSPNHFTSTLLYQQLSAAGLHVVRQVPFNNSQVVEMRR